MFLERQANKEKEGVKEAHKANQQNHPFYSGGGKYLYQIYYNIDNISGSLNTIRSLEYVFFSKIKIS